MMCPDCNGEGTNIEARLYPIGHGEITIYCKKCDGEGILYCNEIDCINQDGVEFYCKNCGEAYCKEHAQKYEFYKKLNLCYSCLLEMYYYFTINQFNNKEKQIDILNIELNKIKKEFTNINYLYSLQLEELSKIKKNIFADITNDQIIKECKNRGIVTWMSIKQKTKDRLLEMD